MIGDRAMRSLFCVSRLAAQRSTRVLWRGRLTAQNRIEKRFFALLAPKYSHLMADTPQEEKQCLKKFLEDVMESRHVRGDVLFSSVAGSHSFNLAVATSDSDHFGVFQGHIDDVLSLIPPPETFDSHNPDYAVFELLMFCKLVLKGNPKLIEPLFSTHLCYDSPNWVELQKVRSSFLSKSVISQYLSYVHSQLKDIQKGEGEKKKKYYHALRLLGEAKRMVEGGVPKVWIDGEERDFLLSIRRGEREEEELVAKVAELQNEIKEKLQTCDLREKADVGPLNDWLVSLRRSSIAKSLQEFPEGRFDIKPVVESPESTQMLEKAQSTLAKNGIQGIILYYGPSGSNLHGRPQEGELEDSICIYAVPTDSAVSIDPPPSKLIVDEEKAFHSDTYTRGMICFEVGHAVSLLAQGNHRMCELVWYTPQTSFYTTNAWEELKASVLLLTVHSLKHYHGIARGSMENLAPEQGKRKNKKVQTPHRTLYHVFRCLWCAEEIANGNIPRMENEKDKKLLEMLKREEGDLEELIKRAKKEEEEVRKLIAKVEMQDFDRVVAGKWLVKVRKAL
eukprot:Phypoly_transcript_04939.p1 GENE.Phypoly_transcript_04939~~Phypoly_transcript_04939.p1  ORF type:complete len:562 (+),score=105.19 Phypoly_transcript_04939:362-2047(+)